MPDTFTKTTTTGLGKRTANSVGAALGGLLMFLASFGLLFWNEGRTDLSSIAVDAIPLDGEVLTTDANVEGSLVSVSGTVTTEEQIGDDLFLADGDYLAVERKVEMYAWVEETEEETSTNLGGSETTTTTYNYIKEWTDSPKAASEFEYPEGHENPGLTVEAGEYTASEMMVGAYSIHGDIELPALEDLSLTDDMLSLSSGAELASSTYVFMGSGTLSGPQLGDVRISYRALTPGFEGTAIGELDRGHIAKYVDEDGNELYRLFSGTRDEAIATLHNEFVTMSWILRVVGFLMMWFGLMAVFGPIATVLDILPVFGSATRFIVGVATFPVALVLSIVTILVSMVLHSLVAVIIAALVVVGLVVYFLKKKRAAMATAPAKK